MVIRVRTQTQAEPSTHETKLAWNVELPDQRVKSLINRVDQWVLTLTLTNKYQNDFLGGKRKVLYDFMVPKAIQLI